MWPLPMVPSPSPPSPLRPRARRNTEAWRCVALEVAGGQESAACALACRVQHANEHEAAEHVAGLARGSAATADEVARQLALDIGEWRAMGNAERRGAWMGMSKHERLELWRGLGR